MTETTIKIAVVELYEMLLAMTSSWDNGVRGCDTVEVCADADAVISKHKNLYRSLKRATTFNDIAPPPSASYLLGGFAYGEGEAQAGNPFPRDTEEFKDWDCGWCDADGYNDWSSGWSQGN